MSFRATIFVEGEADLKFITDFVRNKFDYALQRGLEIQNTNGKDNLLNFVPRFNESSDQQLTNLLIFDADGDYDGRRTDLESKKDSLRIQFEIFLFPDNTYPGDLEALLERIINPENAKIFECFEKFRDCIESIPGINKAALNTKVKIHNYVSVLLDAESAKEQKRDYTNTILWDLNAEHLQPLYNFLSPYFTQQKVEGDIKDDGSIENY